MAVGGEWKRGDRKRKISKEPSLKLNFVRSFGLILPKLDIIFH